MEKVIVIVGQTSSGKSDLAVRVAKKFGGEVIIADSRQIYRGINLGSGKITKEEMRGVPHHLLDIAEPEDNFSVFKYKKLAEKKISEILARGRVPIVSGGTGFYVDALTQGTILPEVPPDPILRRRLAGLKPPALLAQLKRLDGARAAEIDPNNKIRLIRAIEIAKTLGWVPKPRRAVPKFEFIKIGLLFPEKILERRIRTRLRKRLRQGMAHELDMLHSRGIPWKRFEEMGFDQKHVAAYLQGRLNEKELMEKLLAANWRYAKRQMRWFKRDQEIRWFRPHQFPQIFPYLKEVLVS